MHRLHRTKLAEQVKLRLIGLALLSLPCQLSATDTAFWKPYGPNDQTLFLEHFDAEGLPAGKFGGAYQGPAPFHQISPKILSPADVSLEAWVRLEALPEKRAYVFRRASATGKTMGWELFIEAKIRSSNEDFHRKGAEVAEGTLRRVCISG